MTIDTVFLNGTVGSGKSTVAAAIGQLEQRAGRPHAVIDLDDIRRMWPSPPRDRFHHELELANLRDIARNYRLAGAEHVVLAGVIEEASEIPRYEDALATSGLLICRLVVDPKVGAARLTARHGADTAGAEWSLDRMPQLAGILDRADLDHHVFDATTASPEDLASRVRRAANWAD